MKLTNYRKFMVKKFNSFDPPITKQEFCSNHSRENIKVEDFGIWINLYDKYKREGAKPKNKVKIAKAKNPSSKKEVKKKVKPVETKKAIEEKNKKLKKASQLKQIKRYRNVVISERYLFSKDKKTHNFRFKMFFNEEHSSQIYRLALFLAKDLNRAETNLKYVKNKLIISQKEIKELKDKLTSVQKSLDFELERHPSQIVFEIDPSKEENKTIQRKEEYLEKEELNSLCESSINNLKTSLAGVYKILGSLQL